MRTFFKYNVLIIITGIIALCSGVNLLTLSINFIIAPLIVPIIISWKEYWYIGDDFEKEGTINMILEGIKRNAPKYSIWTFYSLLFWLSLGVILLLISLIR